MACPICGANCVCKKRGPSGLCCECHRHKPSRAKVEGYIGRTGKPQGHEAVSLSSHLQWIADEEARRAGGETVSKKKDLRNGKELGRWKPSKWRYEHAARTRSHALDVAYHDLCCDWGEYRAGMVVAEIRAGIDVKVSLAALVAAGVPTQGL